MKLISIIISLFFASTIAVNTEHNTINKAEVTKKVIYDGFDGRLFYFTDHSDNVIIIEEIEASKALETYDLDVNKHVGEAFNLKLKQTTQDNIYSEIEVVSINILK